MQSRIKRPRCYPFAAIAVFAILVSSCGKSVSKEGARFGQIDEPGSTTEPIPDPLPGDPASDCDPTLMGTLMDYSLYAKKGVLLSKTQLAKRAAYGKKFRKKKSTVFGGVEKPSSADLDSDWKKVLAFSTACAASTTNATAEKTCASSKKKSCVLKLHGNDPLLNVVNVGVKQVKGISSIEVDVPPGAVLVANFPTLKAALLRKVEVRATNGMSANRLFWNIPKGRAFAFNRTKFYGTFIAPRANVALSRNEGSGAFWVENLAARKSSW